MALILRTIQVDHGGAYLSPKLWEAEVGPKVGAQPGKRSDLAIPCLKMIVLFCFVFLRLGAVA